MTTCSECGRPRRNHDKRATSAPTKAAWQRLDAGERAMVQRVLEMGFLGALRWAEEQKRKEERRVA